MHNQLTSHAINTLMSLFGIDTVEKFFILNGGAENTNYYIKTKSKEFVLTICEEKSLKHSTNLANLLCYLERQSIYTSQIIPSTDGSNVIIYDNKPVMLKKYIDGDICTDLTDSLMIQLGEKISDLHNIPAPSYLPNSFSYGYQCFDELHEKNILHPFIKWIELKKQYLEKQIPKELPRKIIHGDIFCNNIIIQDNKLVVIMDYEESCFYYRLFDLGMAIIGTCRDGDHICFVKAKKLIFGYEKNQTLQKIEKEKLKIFTMYAATATAFWRFRQHYILHENESLYDRHLEMQNLANNIYNCPTSQFVNLCAA